MFILTLTAQKVVHARDVKSDVKQTIAMTTMDQVPYGFTLDNGEQSGVIYDILNEIIRESGIGLANEVTPANRLIAQLKSNRKMCTIVVDSPSVASNFDLIEPIGYELVVGILPIAGIDLFEYKDLKDLIIAVPLGADINDSIDTDVDIIFSVVSPPQYLNAMRMMHTGRIDGVLGGLSSLRYIARTEGLTNDDFGTALILKRADFYLVCTSSISKVSRQRLKGATTKLRQNGTFKEILKRYFN
jgi:ABC-type amino acid transport substrate-binding protein